MAEISFDGQCVLVTGAGGGLGRQYALELARRGAAVVVNDLGGPVFGSGSSNAAADNVVAEIKAAGGKAIANHNSVACREGAEGIVADALSAFGRVDALISNAGNLRNAPFEETSDEHWAQIYMVHSSGQRWVAEAAYRQMIKQGSGRILFTSSCSGLFGHPEQTAYASAKMSVIGLMHALSNEGEAHGVLVNALAPTAASRMMAAMKQEDMAAAGPIIEKYLGNSFLPEFNMPMAVYLVSPACSSTHGIYSISGGRYSRVAIVAGDGWLAPTDSPPSIEQIRDHFEEITSVDNIHEYGTMAEEINDIIQRRAAPQGT